MNINILRYSLFGIAGGQEVDRNLDKYQLCCAKILVHMLLLGYELHIW